MSYYSHYSEFPEGFVSNWLSGYVEEYDREFRDYWGLDEKEPPQGVDEEAWRTAVLWDLIAEKFLGSARELHQPESGDVVGVVRRLKGEWGLDVQNHLFFRQRFELEIAKDFDWAILEMADRALELLTLLVSVDNDRARKYLQRVADCYIRGMPTETAIMCGAALEAALEDVVSTGDVRSTLRLKNDDWVYAGHRLTFIERKRLMPSHWIRRAREILGDRNEAVHVTPGLVVEARPVVENLAGVLRELGQSGLSQRR